MGRGRPGVTGLDFEPALTQLALPIDGVLSRVDGPDEGVRMRFAWGGARPAPEPARGAVLAGPGTGVSYDAPAQTLHVERPKDALHLRLRLDNLHVVDGVDPDDPPRLVPQAPGDPSRIAVDFDPQHVAEDAVNVLDGEGDPVPPPAAVLGAPAGKSQLGFTVPMADFPDGVPCTLDALLGWTAWAPIARGIPVPGPASDFETAIEAPYWLYLQPLLSDDPAWAHSVEPVTHGGRTELWHTRLGTVGADASEERPGVDAVDETVLPDLRAIWTRSFALEPWEGPDHEAKPDPFEAWNDYQKLDPERRTTLKGRNRRDIVILTMLEAERIRAERFMLTSRGAWFDLQLRKSGPLACGDDGVDLVEWVHRAAMGRDYYVRTMELGYLLPFGHLAVLVTISERTFQETAGGDVVAPIRLVEFVRVLEPLMSYPASHRGLPFRRVRILTLETPPLADDPAALRWLRGEGGGDVPFRVVADDRMGGEVELTLPMAFVSCSNANAMGDALSDDYNDEATGGTVRARRPIDGQKVAYADQGPAEDGQTRFETCEMTFAAQHQPGNPAAPFAGVMHGARVRVEALQQLLGDGQDVAVGYFGNYVDDGFSDVANAGAVFLEVLDEVGLDFGAGGKGDKAGGLMTPNFDVSGLSRHIGLVGGDLLTFAEGVGGDPAEFDPTAFLAEGAKILGRDILADLIESVPVGAPGFLDKAPQLTSFIDDVQSCRFTRFRWQPDVQDVDAGVAKFLVDRGGEASALDLAVELCAKLDADAGVEPVVDISCCLTHFAFEITQVIRVTFTEVRFTAGTGRSPKLDPALAGVELLGALEFVQQLQDFLKSDALGGGPKITVDDRGVHAGFSIGLPSQSVGVLSLENMRLGVGVNVPLDGQPVRVRFNFSERESPFLLTVSFLGGGGFFALHSGADGVEIIEAAFEFGARVSMNIGVASGSVGVAAGIYFRYESDSAVLAGYVRVEGSLCILRIISVSAEFYLELSYDFGRESARGLASLKIKVKVLFFSKTFGFTVEREFKRGGGGDEFAVSDAPGLGRPDAPALEGGRLTFADLMTEPDWVEYAAAFA